MNIKSFHLTTLILLCGFFVYYAMVTYASHSKPVAKAIKAINLFPAIQSYIGEDIVIGSNIEISLRGGRRKDRAYRITLPLYGSKGSGILYSQVNHLYPSETPVPVSFFDLIRKPKGNLVVVSQRLFLDGKCYVINREENFLQKKCNPRRIRRWRLQQSWRSAVL
jgi:hypothetical protein